MSETKHAVSPDRSVNCRYCHQQFDERTCIRGPGGEGSICSGCSCNTEDGLHVADLTSMEFVADAHHDHELESNQVLVDISCEFCGRSGSFILDIPEVNW